MEGIAGGTGKWNGFRQDFPCSPIVPMGRADVSGWNFFKRLYLK